MARADYITRARDILYGSGLGEGPAIRLGAANANESTSGSTVTFTLLAGEGAKVKAGHVLATQGTGAAATDAYAVKVTSVATDTVTGINGWDGSTSITGSDSGNVDNAVWEQNPLVSTYKIHQAVDTIFASALWPHVFKYANRTISSPSQATGQGALAATTMGVESAWQKIGNDVYPVDIGLKLNMDTNLFSTGRMGFFDLYDGSTLYYTSVEKLVIGDEASTNPLVELVATGAAALCLGATVSESNLNKSNRDSEVRGQVDVAGQLWRDFMALRMSWSEGLSRETGNRIQYVRG